MIKENKFSKYLIYAIGEIFLVVIGILIALQINNWNNQRQLNQNEQQILKILKSEFKYNQQELQRNIDKATNLKNRADGVLAFFNTDYKSIKQDELTYLIRGLSGYSTYDPSNGALNNLISSGQLNVIKNDSLRLILSRWSGEVQDVKEDEVRMMAYGDTHLEPIRLRYLKYKTDSNFDRNTLEILDHPEFENIVFRLRKAANYNIENYGLLELEIDRILSLIDKEIK